MSLRTVINRALQGTRYKIEKANPALNAYSNKFVTINIEFFLARLLAEEKGKFFFIQVGANDGVRSDDTYNFITRHKLNGIVIEPLKDMFEKLNRNYSDQPQITKINKAIHPSNASMTLFRVHNEANVPNWCHGIASFDKGHLLKASRKIPNIEKHIIEESVECISLNELLKQTHTEQISFLQIDTEGFDFEIIKMIDFEKFKPSLIRYESAHLSKEDNQLCTKLLHEHGYVFFGERNNIIAIQPQFNGQR